ESANLIQRILSDAHDGPERKIHWLQRYALEDLRPKICVHGDGFKTHRQILWNECIKTVDQTNLRILKTADQRSEKALLDEDIIVRNNDVIMVGFFHHVAKRRDFRVRPEQWRTEDQFSVCFWIFGEKSPNDVASWIICGSHSEEEL